MSAKARVVRAIGGHQPGDALEPIEEHAAQHALLGRRDEERDQRPGHERGRGPPEARDGRRPADRRPRDRDGHERETDGRPEERAA